MLFSYWNPLNIVRFCSMLFLNQFVRIQATILHICITTMMLINTIILSLYIYHYIIHGHYYDSSICWSKYLPMVYFLFLKYLNIFGHCLEKYVDNPSSQSLKLSWILLMHLSFYCPDPLHHSIYKLMIINNLDKMVCCFVVLTTERSPHLKHSSGFSWNVLSLCLS